MKIAILTQPLGHNYGGILQNYALQQVLINLGHEPITLEKDYRQNISIFKLIIEIPKRIITKYILKKREHILSEKYDNAIIKLKRKKLFPFVSKYINHLYVKNHNFINLEEYDVFIVGSDQVWRPIHNLGYIEKMFFSFIPQYSKIKRIAYAASFGTNDWEYNDIQTKRCKDLIKRFDAVSTREINGVELCSKYLKRNDAISVLDPTLLLQKDKYLNLSKSITTNNDNILFAYILDLNAEINNQIEQIAAKQKLTLRLVQADSNCNLSIEEWISMFRDSKCVITDSFHGTVFSIIFNKEFYTISNQLRGGSRFLSLLSQLSLTDRAFDSITNIEIKEQIDWTSVNNKLEILKEKSVNFLKTNLS